MAEMSLLQVIFFASRASPREQRKWDGLRVAWRQCNTRDTVEVNHGQAQREVLPGTKIRIITILLRRAVLAIKLKRTDTTLDLSPINGVSVIARGIGCG